MAKQKNKAELLNDIQIKRRRLEKTLDSLTEIEMVIPGVVGEWSVKDILAHLTAWEQLFCSWYESGLHGRLPETPPVGMSRTAMDALNQKIFVQNQQKPLSEVFTDFYASYQQILALVQAISEDDLFTIGRYGWTGRLALVDYVVGNTCNHYAWAKTHIHKWLQARAD